MQNSTFFVLLKPIFAPKLEIVPPSGFGSGTCDGLGVIWTRIVEFFGFGAHPKLVKTLFFFFFRRSPDFGRKNTTNFGEDFFFGDLLILTEKLPQSNSRLMKIWVKFVCSCNKLPKKPPFAKSWLLAWPLDSTTYMLNFSRQKSSFPAWPYPLDTDL